MKLWVERSYPAIFGVLAGAGYYLVFKDRALPSSFNELMAAVISVAAIAVGFLATAKSILISIENTEIIKKMKGVKYYDHLLDYMMFATWTSFILAALSIFFLMTGWFNKPPSNPPTIPESHVVILYSM